MSSARYPLILRKPERQLVHERSRVSSYGLVLAVQLGDLEMTSHKTSTTDNLHIRIHP